MPFVTPAFAHLALGCIWVAACLGSTSHCKSSASVGQSLTSKCVGLQEQRLHWEERSFTLQTQMDESLSIVDEEPFDLTGGAEDRLALCKPPKVRHSAC